MTNVPYSLLSTLLASVALTAATASPARDGSPSGIVSAVTVPLQDKIHCADEPQAPVYVKIVYRTTDAFGQPTQASGLLAYSTNGPAVKPVLSYQHGTILNRESVPSRGFAEIRDVVCIFRLESYVLVAADYVGLGDSPGFHPYLHAKSIGSATRDLLFAAADELRRRGIETRDELYLTGYSQGGHSTLALLQALETQSSPFKVAAVAPQAGPYNPSGASLFGTLQHPHPRDSLIFAGYVLSAYQRIYGNVWNRPDDVFLAPYVTLPGLFDDHRENEIYSILPNLPADLFSPTFLAQVSTTPTMPLRLDLAENDLYDWKPLAPVRFFFAGSDDIVPPTNAKVAYEAMTRRGATVSLTNVGDNLDHHSGYYPSMTATAAYFKGLQAARP